MFLNKTIRGFLRRLRSAHQEFPPSTRLASHRGQVAVIMILIIAIGLVFYAVVLNLGRISQVKTQTMIAANTTAGQLASFMASYGQKYFEESLGGRRKVCALSGLFMALLMVVIIIIVIIIIIVTWGAGSAVIVPAIGLTAAMAVTLAVIGLVLAMVSLFLQLAVVEPGITEMWNRMMSDTLDITDQFVERAVQSALSSAATDQAKVPDLFDLDTDGLFGYPGNDPTKNPNDSISRFGFLYTQRLAKIPPPTEKDAIDKFKAALEQFLKDDGDSWGISDAIDRNDDLSCSIPGSSNCCPSAAQLRCNSPRTDPQPAPCSLVDSRLQYYPAECNPCCQPPSMLNPLCLPAGAPDLPDCCQATHANPECASASPPPCCTELGNLNCSMVQDCRTVSLRPACCDYAVGHKDANNNFDKCGDTSNCIVETAALHWATTPYYSDDGNNTNDYPWVFDRYYDNSENGFLSFREKIGRDDEHQGYRIVTQGSFSFLYSPVIHDVIGSAVVAFPPSPPSPPPPVRLPGFNLSDTSGFYSPTDIRKGIFPFFYKIADLGVDLRNLSYQDAPTTWNDPNRSFKRECHWCDSRDPGLDPSCSTSQPPYLAGEVPSKLTLPAVMPAPFPDSSGGWCVDKINTGIALEPPQLLDRVTGLSQILSPQDRCAATDAAGGWKRGGDRFCTNQYPYSLYCPKHGATPCQEPYDSDGDGTDDAYIDVACKCGQAGAGAPALWPDDKIDGFLYGSPDFIIWAEQIVKTPTNVLVTSFDDWYDEAAYWIEPLCPDPGAPDPASDPCPGSYTKKVRNISSSPKVDWSNLAEWRKEFREFNNPIKNWMSAVPNATWDPANPDATKVINRNGQANIPGSYVGNSCVIDAASDTDSVWCVPPAVIPPVVADVPNRYGLTEECGCVTPEEAGVVDADSSGTFDPDETAVAFDYNHNGVRGDLYDVVACLNYNVNDVDIYKNALGNDIPAQGNYNKFKLCQDACADANPANDDVNCGKLPRSLAPGFCALGYTSSASAQVAINNCLASADIQECDTNCNTLDDPPYNVAPYNIPPYTAPDFAAIATINSCVNQCTLGNNPCTAACDGVPASATCNNIFGTRNDYENATCGLLGSCCEFPPPYPGLNLFYDALAANSGICGGNWIIDYPSFGMNVPFIREIYRAIGSCFVGSESINPFVVAVNYALTSIADPVLDAADYTKLNNCLGDIAAGCPTTVCQDITAPSPTALTLNHAAVPYNLPRWESGIIGKAACDDSPTDDAMINCLSSCSVPNCADINNGGSMPVTACDGTTDLGLDDAPTLGPPPAVQADIDACLTDCVGNNASCANVDAYYGWGLFRASNKPASDWFKAACSNFGDCMTNVCGPTGYTLPDGSGLQTFNCDDGFGNEVMSSYHSPLQLCASTYENSCSWWGQNIDVSDDTDGVAAGRQPWHDSVQNALLAAVGSCADPAFITKLNQSVVEAQVQVKKMEKRLQFLQGLLQGAVDISYTPANAAPGSLYIDNPYIPENTIPGPIPPANPTFDDKDLSDRRFQGFNGGLLTIPPQGGVLSEGTTHFTRFLDNDTPFYDPGLPLQNPLQPYDASTNRRVQDSPVEALIDARMHKEVLPKLPAVAVYAWKDLPKAGQTQDPRWHIVKAEVRMPRRCNNACGLLGTKDPQWPRIITYSQSWGMERCYELVNTEGMVKVRVIRFDEDRSWNTLTFPDGTPIWDIRFFHPDRKKVDAQFLLDPTPSLGRYCLEQVDPAFVDPTCASGGNCLYPWGNAFMLNQRPNFHSSKASDIEYSNCWSYVHEFLENGVKSESCAIYYFQGGMKAKFVHCDAAFTNGNN